MKGGLLRYIENLEEKNNFRFKNKISEFAYMVILIVFITFAGLYIIMVWEWMK